MNEQIIKYFQGELNTTERLQFLRQVETNSELKKQFIEYKNMHALLTLSDQSDNKEVNRQGYILFNKIIRTKKDTQNHITYCQLCSSHHITGFVYLLVYHQSL